jgi:hypothetical protein
MMMWPSAVVGSAEPARRRTADQIVHRLIGEHRDLTIEQRHVDRGARAGRVALAQCGEDGDGRVQAGEQIGIGDARLLRLARRIAGKVHAAAEALDHEIVSGLIRAGTILPEAADRAIHQSRKRGAQTVAVQPVAGEAAHLEVLDQHIGFGRQLADPRLIGRIGDIERDRPFAPVAGMVIGRAEVHAIVRFDERRPPVPGIVADAGPFDLDDFRAEIRQQLACPGAGEDAREFEDAHALQRAGHGRGAGKACYSAATAGAKANAACATGPKLRRCSGEGPCSRNARRCSGAP